MSEQDKKQEQATQGLAVSKVEHKADDGATVLDENLVKARKLPPAHGAELKEGDILGKCKIEKELGRGGMGAVYLARHMTLDVQVAVKVLPPEIANRHHQFAERFMREARLAAKIKHQNIMGVLDADQDEKTKLYYIVLEFVDGGSVRDQMDDGPMSEVRTVDIALSVAEALDAASDFQIVHRDIKPDNIMLTKKGAVKLADMGIAKQCGAEDTGITMTSSMMGTPAYISPEQAMDAKHADHRADIYSLGATMYHMLCGAPPYEGETTYAVLTQLATAPIPDPCTRRPDLSPEVAALIMRMMSKAKEDRPQTAKLLVEEISRVRSRIATSVTAVQEGGEIKLVDLPKTPQGTPTQGIVGTAFQPSGASTGAATVAEASPYATPQPTQQTAAPTAAASSQTGLHMALAACILIIGAVAVILALRDGETKPPQPQPVNHSVQAPIIKPAVKPVSDPQRIPEPDMLIAMAETRDNGMFAKGVNLPAGNFPGRAVPVAPKTVAPKDEELVKQAVAALEKLPMDDVTAGVAQFKGGEVPMWPDDAESRMIGFGTSETQAKQAALKTALDTMLHQVVLPKEWNDAKKGAAITKILDNAPAYMLTAAEFDKGEKDGTHYVALEATPRAAKIGKALYMDNIEVKQIYDLVGQPSIGIDIPEKVDNKAGGVKDNAIRRAQMRLEKAIRAAGMASVDVTGVPKDKQREICDILIVGTSQAGQRWNKPLPGGGTQPLYVYNAEIALNIQLSPTKRTIYNEIFSFKPTGMDEIKKFGNFDSDEAAKTAIETSVEQNMAAITKSITDEWVKLSGDVDYWVGVGGLTGGMDVLNVKKNLKAIPGVKKVVPRYYKDGTQYVGLVYPDTAAALLEAMVTSGGYTLEGQRGAMLLFKVKK